MSAEFKIYSDEECTVELAGGVGLPYEYQIGPITGLNGTDGEVKITSIWVKNTGDVLLSFMELTETEDADGRADYSLDGETYNLITLPIGDLEVDNIVRVYIRVTVEPSTVVHIDEPLNITISSTHL